EKILKNSTKEFDAMWNVLKQYVLYNYQDFYRFYKAEKGLRKSVLTIDTDSNFVYLDPVYQYLKKKFPDKVTDNDLINRIYTIQVINHNLTNLLEDVFYTLCKEMGIQEYFIPIIAMDYDLLFDRIVITTKN